MWCRRRAQSCSREEGPDDARGTPRAPRRGACGWTRGRRASAHPGFRSTNGSHTDGIASSCAPATTSVGTRDAADPVDDAPVLERADDVELAGPVHGVVDGRVLLELGEGVEHLRRVGHHPADVAVVEDLHRGEVLGGVGGAGLLVAGQRLLHLERAAGCAASLAASQPQRHRRGAVADGQALHARAGRRGRPPARASRPRTARAGGTGRRCRARCTTARSSSTNSSTVQKRRVGVGQVGAAAAAELVVVDDRPAVAGRGWPSSGM